MKRSISSFFESNKKICSKSNECESQSIGDRVEVENSMADFEFGVDVGIDIDDSSQPTASCSQNTEMEVTHAPSDISKCASEEPKQPVLKIYQKTVYGKEERSFKAGWYKLFPWIEYSMQKNSVFCFPCRMFSTSHHNRAESTFINIGYNNWKRAMEKESGFRKHENSCSHKSCQASWISYKEIKSRGSTSSVFAQINDGYLAEIKENRQYIAKIAEVLRFSASQVIAQRGHDESDESENQGNFLELLNLLAKTDPIIRKKLEDGPKNAKYTHHSVQNEIIRILCKLTLDSIKNEVNRAKYFAISVDESKDIRKAEQVSIVLRYYVDNSICERFLGFRTAEKLDAKSLLGYMKSTLHDCGIDINNCVAQTYDGASVMSGRLNGVQALLREEVPQAVYVHCMNHRLNLVTVNVCKGIKLARDLFSLLEQLYIFLSGSATHATFVAIQKKLAINVIELKRLSDTRWACQAAACEAVKRTLPAILITLTQLSEENCSRSTDARGLLNQIDISLLFGICFFSKIFKDLKIVSDHLQAKDSDLAHAYTLISATCCKFEEMRNSSEAFKEIWEECKELAERNGIDSKATRTNRVRRLPSHLAQYLLTEEFLSLEEESPQAEEEFRVQMFIPTLDRIVEELRRRFVENSSILDGVNCLHPESRNFLEITKLKVMAAHYGCDTESLEVEIKLIPKVIKRFEDETGIQIKTLSDFAQFLEKYRIAFHELYQLAVIAITIPVSSATCERTFSCLRRLKTYLRNSMSNERMSALAVLAVEKTLAKGIDLDNVVDMFDASHKNLRIALH